MIRQFIKNIFEFNNIGIHYGDICITLDNGTKIRISVHRFDDFCELIYTSLNDKFADKKGRIDITPLEYEYIKEKIKLLQEEQDNEFVFFLKNNSNDNDIE